MQIHWYQTVDDLGEARITPLEGSPVDFSYGLLRAMERSLWGDLRVRYLAVETQGTVLAFTPVYYGTNIEFMAIMPGPIQRAYNALVQHMGLKNAYRVAAVGSLPSDRGWIPMLPDCDVGAVVDLIIRAVDEFCREESLHLCIFKDLNQSFPGLDRFRAAGLVETYSLPTVRVNTDFDSREAYIQSLTANGRSHARRTLKKAKKNFDVRILTDYEELLPKLYPLWRATYLKAQFKLEELSPRFFLECARTSPPESELVLCEKDGRIAGCYLCFFCGGQRLNKRVGMDYSMKDTGTIYNILNYHSLLRGVEQGITTSYLGQTSYTPKLRMGGVLENQYLFIKGYRLSVRMGFPLQRLWMQQFRAERVQESVKQGKRS